MPAQAKVRRDQILSKFPGVSFRREMLKFIRISILVIFRGPRHSTIYET